MGAFQPEHAVWLYRADALDDAAEVGVLCHHDIADAIARFPAFQRHDIISRRKAGRHAESIDAIESDGHPFTLDQFTLHQLLGASCRCLYPLR